MAASLSDACAIVIHLIIAERMEFVNTYQKLSLAKNGKKA
jgi:hypothetical protein